MFDFEIGGLLPVVDGTVVALGWAVADDATAAACCIINCCCWDCNCCNLIWWASLLLLLLAPCGKGPVDDTVETDEWGMDEDTDIATWGGCFCTAIAGGFDSFEEADSWGWLGPCAAIEFESWGWWGPGAAIRGICANAGSPFSSPWGSCLSMWRNKKRSS